MIICQPGNVRYYSNNIVFMQCKWWDCQSWFSWRLYCFYLSGSFCTYEILYNILRWTFCM